MCGISFPGNSIPFFFSKDSDILYGSPGTKGELQKLSFESHNRFGSSGAREKLPWQCGRNRVELYCVVCLNSEECREVIIPGNVRLTNQSFVFHATLL